jgi:VWFA-related protein
MIWIIITEKAVTMKRTAVVLCVFLGWLPSLFSYALLGERRSRASLQHEVTVCLKLIQVYVTDKKGDPVNDLTKEDFIVLDSGREVTITEFEKHILQPAARESVSQPSAEELAPTRTLSQKYLIFFDFAFNSQRGIQRSIQAAIHFLDKNVSPGDEVALLSYSMVRGLQVHEYLTPDHDKVRDAIKAITAKAIAGRASEIEEVYWREAQDGSSNPFQASSPNYNWQRKEAKSIAQQYILRMTALARALRTVEGQKNFIFFSSGLPASMIYGNQAGNPATGQTASRYDVGDPVLRPLNEELYRELSASNCSFYVFDTRDSAKVPSLFEYDEETFKSGGRGKNRLVFSEQGVFQDTTSLFRDDKTTGIDSLKRLTDVTGGKFFSNIQFFSKNLAQVETLTGSFYVLGYYIDQNWDGRFHEIKVEVLRKGCQVRAQAGYYNPKPFREYSDLEKRLQLLDLALNERSLFQTPKILPMIAMPLQGETDGRVQMMVRIPGWVLADLSGREVEFVSVVFDEKDNLVELQRTKTDLALFQGRDITYMSGARLAPGRYKCRIVVRNLESGASAVASALATVAVPAPGGLSLQAPLLLVQENSPVSLEARGKGKSSLLFWRNLYPFDRSNCAPLIGGLSKGVPKIFVIAPCLISKPDQPAIAISAFLIKAETGERMSAAFRLVFRERRESFEILFLEFPADALAPGCYLLYLHAGDGASPSLSWVHTAFEILS